MEKEVFPMDVLQHSFFDLHDVIIYDNLDLSSSASNSPCIRGTGAISIDGNRSIRFSVHTIIIPCITVYFFLTSRVYPQGGGTFRSSR